MEGKRIIWTNKIDISSEAVKKYWEELFPSQAAISPQRIRTFALDQVSETLERVLRNLDIPTASLILAIVDRDMWGYPRRDYQLLERNVNEIFGVSYGDSTTIYANDGNIYCEDHCSSGLNRYMFRELAGNEDDCKPLLYAIRNHADHEVIKDLSRQYTQSMFPYVAKVFGWPVEVT